MDASVAAGPGLSGCCRYFLLSGLILAFDGTIPDGRRLRMRMGDSSPSMNGTSLGDGILVGYFYLGTGKFAIPEKENWTVDTPEELRSNLLAWLFSILVMLEVS